MNVRDLVNGGELKSADGYTRRERSLNLHELEVNEYVLRMYLFNISSLT